MIKKLFVGTFGVALNVIIYILVILLGIVYFSSFSDIQFPHIPYYIERGWIRKCAKGVMKE